ncbi:MAG: acylphosphatase, partial [Brachybacterium sp.]|nr:acylphosphatase [Brachybacterium sp.]
DGCRRRGVTAGHRRHRAEPAGGSVEAALEGCPEAVETMIDHLRRGPSSARVDGIDVRREAPRGAGPFRITG